MSENKSRKEGSSEELTKAEESKKEELHKQTEAIDYKAKFEQTEKEAKENYNKWLYLKADFENFKKRIYKEQAEFLKYGYERFARELLHVVDSLEWGLSHAKGYPHGLEEGFRLTLKQCFSIFAQFGITPIESVGKKFDPKFHEAVAEEEVVESEPLMIIREHRKGYLFHDRLLRAAQVIVAKQKEQG